MQESKWRVKSSSPGTAVSRLWLQIVAVFATLMMVGMSIITLTPLANADPAEEEDNSDTVTDAEVEAHLEKLRALSAETSSTPFGVGSITGPLDINATGTNYGSGYEWYQEIGNSGYPTHWIGAFNINGPQYCINFDSRTPAGNGVEETNFGPTINQWDPNKQYIFDDVRVNNAQLAYIMKNHSASKDATNQAAISFLTHTNYEEGGGLNYIHKFVTDVNRSDTNIMATAREYVAEAKANVVTSLNPITMKVADNNQNFTISGIGAKNVNGGLVSGYPYTITLTGSAVFDEGQSGITLSNGGKTASGKTAASLVSLTGHSTANGSVTADLSLDLGDQARLVKINRADVDLQDTLTWKTYKSEVKTSSTGPAQPIVYNFQPTLVSDVVASDSLTVNQGSSLKDTLTVDVKKDSSNSKVTWLGVGATYPGQDSYKPLPVQFEGTAYYVGETPASSASNTVPEGAIKVASTTFVADKGPGTYEVEANYKLPAGLNGGFITWVWNMDADNQPQIADEDLYMLQSDWQEVYAADKEQSSILAQFEIESNIKVHETNNNTYLVDDVWLTDFPSDHPDFEGDREFGPDTKTVTQSLYFWADGTEIKENSVVGAQLVSSVEIPAKNGYYPSVGSTNFKLLRDENGNLLRGTYQFVHNFKGDDRVASATSQIPDVYEQYVVTREEIGTTASNGGLLEDTEGNITQQIIDEVCYSGLIAGKEYSLSGVLMDKATGEAITDKAGNKVTSSLEFTAEESDGCVDMVFQTDAANLEGKTTVVFETLYREGKEVASHADINDVNQTVDIPEVKTTAGNGGVEEEDGVWIQNITDTVCYTNLVPGKEYKVSGVLMDKSTGEPITDQEGNKVTGEATFTAEKSEGCIDIEFKTELVNVAGKNTVVFEDLFQDNLWIGVHADIEDEGQTVDIPEIGTTAANGGIEEEEGIWIQNITDTVCYKNLVPGKEYKVSGVLMDKSTGEPILDKEGNTVTGESTFTPTEADGCVEVEFKTELVNVIGKTTVVFEDLYQDELHIGVHADIEDEGQTVDIPEIGTTATSEDGSKTISSNGTVKLVDKVCYSNVTVGKEYTIEGQLMDKASGKPLKGVTSSATFTPKEKDGCENVTFTFDVSKLSNNSSVVVFEDMYQDGVHVAVHADLEDEGQTVAIKKPEDPSDPLAKTGASIAGIVLFAGVALAGGTAFALRNRKSNI